MSMQQNNNIWCLCRKLRPIELQQHRQWLSCVWWKKCFALTVSSLGVFSMLCCDGDCSLLILLGFHDERETKLRSWGSCAGGFASASHAWSSQGPKVLGLESWQFVNDLLRFMTILAKRLLMMALCQCLVSVALLSLMTRSTLLRHYRQTWVLSLIDEWQILAKAWMETCGARRPIAEWHWRWQACPFRGLRCRNTDASRKWWGRCGWGRPCCSTPSLVVATALGDCDRAPLSFLPCSIPWGRCWTPRLNQWWRPARTSIKETASVVSQFPLFNLGECCSATITALCDVPLQIWSVCCSAYVYYVTALWRLAGAREKYQSAAAVAHFLRVELRCHCLVFRTLCHWPCLADCVIDFAVTKMILSHWLCFNANCAVSLTDHPWKGFSKWVSSHSVCIPASRDQDLTLTLTLTCINENTSIISVILQLDNQNFKHHWVLQYLQPCHRRQLPPASQLTLSWNWPV